MDLLKTRSSCPSWEEESSAGTQQVQGEIFRGSEKSYADACVWSRYI